MTIQAVLLGCLIATLYGAGFHLWRGGSIWRLFLYIVFAWVGFWGGHFLAGQLGWQFLQVGSLNLGMATILSVLVLGIGYWLSLAQIESNPSKR